jgi:Rap1a immunity proteins
MREALLGLLAAALVAGNANAQVMSANELLPACRDVIAGVENRELKPGTLDVQQGACLGIIRALSYVARSLPPDLSSCAPQSVIVGQVMRVVVTYIERRPERMHEDFRYLAIEALHEAWPCN